MSSQQNLQLLNPTALLLILLTLLPFEILNASIIASPSSVANIGDSVTLNCVIPPSEDILQVTWQKHKSADQWDNIASYSNFFGIRIQPPYVGRLSLVPTTPIQLKNSSLVFSHVILSDKGNYKCLFSGHPDGVLVNITSLHINSTVIILPTILTNPTTISPSIMILPSLPENQNNSDRAYNFTSLIIICVLLFVFLIVLSALVLIRRFTQIVLLFTLSQVI